jgi:hypothetical protein
MPLASLGGPFDWRVTQAAFDYLALQAIGVLSYRGACHERVLVHSIGFDLSSDVLVKTGEPFVRHMLGTHDKFLRQLKMNFF